MLQIINKNIDQIVSDHYYKMKDVINNRIKFYSLYLDVIDQRKKDKVISDFNMEMQFRKSTLINVLSSKQIKSTFNSFSEVRKKSILKRKYKNNYQAMRELLNFLSDDKNIKRILISKPNDLLNIDNEINDLIKIPLINFRELFEAIFSYDKFISIKNDYYNAYDLAKALNINTCPYCNRQYTFTVIEEQNIIRPEFDHFFARSDYPILALSFYNLIPSCHICNSNLKGDTQFDLDNYLHPYLEGFNDDAYFVYKLQNYDSDPSNVNNYVLDIEIASKCNADKQKKIKSNIALFRLREIYNYHKDIIGEINLNYSRNSKRYLDHLEELSTGVSTKEEIYRFYFNNYLLQEEHSNRVLSKFTRDIVKTTPGFEKLFN